MYHSATPELGAEYQQQVQVVWPEEQRVAGLVGATPLAPAWAATIATPLPGFSRVPHVQPPGTVQDRDHHAAYRRRRGAARPWVRYLPGAPIGLAYQPPPSRRAGG